MAIGTQDYNPSLGVNEAYVATYHIAFTTNNTSDPAESSFYGGHISDITRADVGVFTIDLTSKAYMYKVIGAGAIMLESADPEGTPDNQATQHSVGVYIDESVASGCRIRVVTRTRTNDTAADTTDRRVLVTLHVLQAQPTYSYA